MCETAQWLGALADIADRHMACVAQATIRPLLGSHLWLALERYACMHDTNAAAARPVILVARAARDRWPPIELIITSGRHRLSSYDIPPRGQFVPKPYNQDALVTTIRKMAA